MKDVLQELSDMLTQSRPGIASSDINALALTMPIRIGLIYKIKTEIERLRAENNQK